MFQIVRLRLRANTPVLCHLLVGSVLPSFLFQSSLVHSVLCCNSEVSELSFQFFFVCGVCLIILSLVFTRNFCDEICLPRTTNFPVLSCCSVLLQHVCCFGFIFYPPRSPQEVWRVWWVASCFWVRDPPKARFFPPALSETTGVLRKLQNFSVCGAENDFLVNTV